MGQIVTIRKCRTQVLFLLNSVHPILGTGCGVGVGQRQYECFFLGVLSSTSEEEESRLNSRRGGTLGCPGKIAGRGGMGGDNDREGLNSQDKKRGMYWGTWPVLSRPVQLNMGGLVLGMLEIGLEFCVSLIIVFEIV